MQPDLPPVDEEELSEEEPAFTLAADSPEWPTFKRAAELQRRKIALTKELEEVTEDLEHITPMVLSYFLQRGLAHGITVDGWKLMPRRELWVRPKVAGGQKQVCAIMRACGWGHFVHDTYNASQVSAHVREIERNHAAELASGQAPDVGAFLPVALAAVLNVNPTTKLRGGPAKRTKHEE